MNSGTNEMNTPNDVDDLSSDDDITLQLLDASDETDDGALTADDFHMIEALAGSTVAAPPSKLLAEVMSAARQRRAAGPAHGEPPPAVSPTEAFLATAADLHDLLLGLSDEEWELPTDTSYGRVRDVVAHLIGIERLSLGWYGELPMPPAEIAGDHLAVSLPAIEEMAELPGPEVGELWYEAVRRVAAVAATLPEDTFLMMHDIPGSVEASLLLRTFEMWAHADDICQAVTKPSLSMDPSRLLLLSSRLIGVLPFAFELSGHRPPDAVTRVVLTGDGGGTYDVAFGSTAQTSTTVDPTATIIATAFDICRLASRRLSPATLPASSEGDADLVEDVLAHVGAFSRD